MIGTTETLKLSDQTTVDVGVLDGDEADSADMIVADRAGGPDRDGNFPVLKYGILSPKVYAYCSIRKINGETVSPLSNEAQCRALSKRLSVAEIRVLGDWARQRYSLSDADVKNEPGAPESSAE